MDEILPNDYSTERQAKCVALESALSRFLDNDLRGTEAIRVSAHLHGCMACRSAFDGLRAQRALVSAIATPPGAAAARARVLTRFEHKVRTDSIVAAAGSRAAYRRSWTLGGGLAAGLCAACCCGAAALFLTPRIHGSGSRRHGTASIFAPLAASPAAGPLHLPEKSDLAALFALHDTGRRNTDAVPQQPSHDVAAPDAGQMAAHARRKAAARHQLAKPLAEPEPLTTDDLPEAL